MNNKVLIWEGLGFPVALSGFDTRVVRGNEVPDINMKEIQDMAFLSLITWESRFTGQHVRFIRSYLQERQSEMAEAINITRSLISQWESKGNEHTGMDINTELILRCHMLYSIRSPYFRKHGVVALEWKRIKDRLLEFLNGAGKKFKQAGEPIVIEKEVKKRA